MNRRQNCGFAVNNGVDNAIVNELTGCNKCSPNSTTPMQCLRVLVRLDVFMFSFYELAVCWLDGEANGEGLLMRQHETAVLVVAVCGGCQLKISGILITEL